MSGQVLLRGDLASQWPSLFQSCRALLYLQIRRCLAKPLYCPAFYLKVKADLAPVALSPSLSVCLSTCQSLSHMLVFPSACVSVCHFRLSLTSPVCLYLSSVICFPILCILHPVLCTPCSLSPHLAFTYTHTHTSLQQHQSNTPV